MFNPQVFAIAKRIMREKLSSTRMVIMLPILILFIPGMAWAFLTQKSCCLEELPPRA